MAPAANSAPMRIRVIRSPPPTGLGEHASPGGRPGAARSAICGCMILTLRPGARRVRGARAMPPPEPATRSRRDPVTRSAGACRPSCSPPSSSPRCGDCRGGPSPVRRRHARRRRPRPSPPSRVRAGGLARGRQRLRDRGLRRAAWAGSRRPAPRTVRFTLCAPDGAFPARLAHPALGILDARGRRAASRRTRRRSRTSPGAGPFRIEAWTDGDNVRLARVGARPRPGRRRRTRAAASPSPAAVPPSTIVLRWAAVAREPHRALRAADVDGIDAPSAADLEDISTLPELVVLPRPGLATAYLGIGAGHQLGRTAVRRAFAMGLDRDSLARDGVRARRRGRVAPRPVPGPRGLRRHAVVRVQRPGRQRAPRRRGVRPRRPGPAPRPRRAGPRAPRPGGPRGAAIRDQLARQPRRDHQGPAPSPRPSWTPRSPSGGSTACSWPASPSPLADASGYLGPLFGPGTTTMAAVRGKGVREALDGAAGVTDPVDRAEALGEANDELRAIVAARPARPPGRDRPRGARTSRARRSRRSARTRWARSCPATAARWW